MQPTRFGRLALAMAVSSLALAACKKAENTDSATPNVSESAPVVVPDNVTAAPTPVAASSAPAADNTDTLDGSKLASFTGNATKGGIVFLQCKVCHEFDKNKIGPQLKGIVGRKAASVADFVYSDADKASGITWTPEKLFQYIEKPQRIVPGTKMTFAGIPEAQKRADLIAYLKAN